MTENLNRAVLFIMRYLMYYGSLARIHDYIYQTKYNLG